MNDYQATQERIARISEKARALGLPAPADIAQYFNNTTHHPERAAAWRVNDAILTLTQARSQIDALAADPAATAIDANAEYTAFAGRYIGAAKALWMRNASLASSFVTGPANFPVRQMEKRNRQYHGASIALDAMLPRAIKAIRRKAFPHGAPGDPIRAADPSAQDKIRDKITKLEAERDQAKATNKAVRAASKGATKDDAGDQLIQGRLIENGMDPVYAKAAATRDYAGRRGVPGYVLTNRGAEIRRLKARLDQMAAETARAADPDIATEQEIGGATVIENVEAARIQLVFPGKPSAEIRARLKANGFRWAPSQGAWQRHLNANGRAAARRALAAC